MSSVALLSTEELHALMTEAAAEALQGFASVAEDAADKALRRYVDDKASAARVPERLTKQQAIAYMLLRGHDIAPSELVRLVQDGAIARCRDNSFERREIDRWIDAEDARAAESRAACIAAVVKSTNRKPRRDDVKR